MPRSIQVGVPSGWFSVTKLIAAPCSGRLNLVWPVVDQITMSTPGVSHPSPTTVEDFRRVLDERAVQPLFQPLIDLESRHVLGYEVLARGPMGPALESPAALFGAAWRAGRVAELDWACRAAAFTEAAEAGLGPPFTLFVNAEPVSLGSGCPDDLRPAVELGRRRLRVVMEVTEWAVAGDPARLLATVAQARQAGWGVALDDVGAAPASLAVLPFVRPDAVKLDMRLLQGRTTAEAAHIVNTVRAQAERTDALVIAEASRRSSTPARPRPPAPPSARGYCSAIRRHCRRRCRRPPRPSRSAGPRRPPPPPPHGRWWPRSGRRAGSPRTCWPRRPCSWSTRALTRPSPTSCWPASRRWASSARPSRAGTSSWPPGRRSPAPSATACR